VFQENQDSTLVALIDGLGSGNAAHEAATLAQKCITEHSKAFLPDLLQLCHQELRGTRGAVIMCMRVEHLQEKVSFAGVGNIGVRVFSDTPIKPISRNGIVGFRMNNVREFSYLYTPGDVFVLHSDGISTRFSVDERWIRDPHTDLQEVAEDIAENYGKDNDDVTIIVVR
jgi:serine/threonine protein phosphatase PrpC